MLLPEEKSGSSSSRRGLRTIAPGLSRGLHVRGDDVNDREDFVDSLDADDGINLNHTESNEEVMRFSLHSIPGDRIWFHGLVAKVVEKVCHSFTSRSTEKPQLNPRSRHLSR